MIATKTSSAEETLKLAEAFADVLHAGDVVLLIGDMGAGKTTFVQGVGRAFGVAEPVTSPTFVLLHTYESKIPLHHADLYRLDSVGEVLDLGIMEMLDDGGVVLVEWGDRGLPAFPTDVMRIEFFYGPDENVRECNFEPAGKSWRVRESAIAEAIRPWSIITPEGGGVL